MSEPPIRLVAFDMEGCLTAEPTVWEIMHRKLGTWQSHGLPYWDLYRAGAFGYDEFLRMDVAVWRGAPAAMLLEAAAEVPLMAGCAEVLRELSLDGTAIAVITNGLTCVADRFQRGFGVRHAYANRPVADGDRLTGEVEIRVPYSEKGAILRRLMAELGVWPEEVAAVGDSASDVAMFRAARVGVAVRPSEASVAEAATHVVEGGDLRALLPILRGAGRA